MDHTDHKTKLKILVADDDEMTCDFLAKFFEKRGFTVTCLDNGQKLFETALLVKFDIILSDINLKGDMKGDHAAKLLRTAGCNTPIIAISGLSEHEWRMLKYSFRYICRKPVVLNHLLVLIYTAIADYSIENEER